MSGRPQITRALEVRPAIQPLEGGLLLHAPAKINLDLLVGPRRTDGFHPLDSLVAKVTLYDRIELHPQASGKFTLDCRGADCGDPDKNLAMRAARLMAAGNRVASPFSGLHIVLDKHIPPGKGLGGGSSDAAAVLAGLNELWRLGLSQDRLRELGSQLGSDVPLFLGPPALRMTGRGECVEPLQVYPFIAVLFLADLHCSTAEVYRTFDQAGCHGGRRSYGSQLRSDVPPCPSTGSAVMPSRQFPREILTQPPSAWRDQLANDLAAPALAVCPPLADLWHALQNALPIPVHMTGSGSALFCLCDDQTELDKVIAEIPPAIPAQAVIVSMHR